VEVCFDLAKRLLNLMRCHSAWLSLPEFPLRTPPVQVDNSSRS
jgi:hypothetical protein